MNSNQLARTTCHDPREPKWWVCGVCGDSGMGARAITEAERSDITEPHNAREELSCGTCGGLLSWADILCVESDAVFITTCCPTVEARVSFTCEYGCPASEHDDSDRAYELYRDSRLGI